MIPSYFQIPFQSAANPDAVVCAPQMRFTILTPQLIRIEHSPRDQFQDRASQVFWHRLQPVPRLDLTRSGDELTITTDALRLHYRITPRGPALDTLSIELLASGVIWHFGETGEKENLRGTARTLDGVDGAVRLERGLMSRAGWAVVDDSQSLLFTESGWIERRPGGDAVDLYFFGYGHDYKLCLRDFARVAGQTPLVPRWMLGNWWSRYWAYSQQELLALMREFRQRGIPLSVCIVDMDWHVTQTDNTCSGWTGYTWNRELFPAPDEFLRQLHAMELKVALNLHPAEGIHPHEAQYEDMARALGIDPATRQPVEFNLGDPGFARAYFEILHHPYEAQGVDFWWLDWQQGTKSKLEGLDPLTWLNHLHHLDLGREGTRRPVIFSRYGGLGSHRYPIGFSGDSIISWNSLAFQPYFTSTAANVGFGWWSHDIGGHWRGVEEPELYARWVQLGALSPILRLHSTKNAYHERRPWGWGEDVLRVTRSAMQFRHALIPYLYTMARRNTALGQPVITPMYYDHPEDEEAYRCPNQFAFGSELIAAPYTTRLDPDTQLSRQEVWLPPGDWFDFFTGEHRTGGRWRAIYGGLDEIPLFARAGAIIPLAPAPEWGGVANPTELDLHLFAGADNRFELYEDDGETTGYLQARWALTPFELKSDGSELVLAIGPVSGDAAQVPPSRVYNLHLHGVREPRYLRLTIAGQALTTQPQYDSSTEELTLRGLRLQSTETLELVLRVDDGDMLSRRDRRKENIEKRLGTMRMDTEVKRRVHADLDRILQEPDLLHSYGPGLRDTHHAVLRSIVESR